MSARSVFDAVIDPGIRNPNFFEGRLLTAADLRDDQKAHRERQRLLGRAIGAGVVEGLTVSLETAPTAGVQQTVTIAQGYALNGEGQLLCLKQDITADIVPPTVVPEPPATLFARCEDATPTPTVPVGVGLYILVMSPASGYRERAPKSGLGSEGKIIGCGDRYAVDGVRFRLEPLPPEIISGASDAQRAELVALLNATGDAASRSLLRNIVANLCFGTPQLAQFPVDPFARKDGASAYLAYGAIDDLRALERLTDCDVPLALLLWNTSGIAFLDLWSVRRRPVPPRAGREWPAALEARLGLEAHARLEQFHAHILDLLGGDAATATTQPAEMLFRFLPPAGLLPLSGGGRSAGLALPVFFGNQTLRGPFHIEGARLVPLLERSMTFPSLQLGEDIVLWLYLLRENRQAVAAGTTAPTAVFASGHLPFVGDARFDVNRWDFSNYGSVLLS